VLIQSIFFFIKSVIECGNLLTIFPVTQYHIPEDLSCNTERTSAVLCQRAKCLCPVSFGL